MHCSLFNALQNMRVYLFFLLSNQNPSTTHTHIRYTVFSSNHNLHKSLHGISFWASDPFWKIYQLKCLNPINKDHAKFYECCELMKKAYLDLVSIHDIYLIACKENRISSQKICTEQRETSSIYAVLFHRDPCLLDILFRQITTFIKVRVAFVYGLRAL